MTDNVIHLLTPTQGPGLRGLHYRIEHKPPRAPRMIGHPPGRPQQVVESWRLELAPRVDLAELEVGARVWTEYEEGAGGLMAEQMAEFTKGNFRVLPGPVVSDEGVVQTATIYDVLHGRAQGVSTGMTIMEGKKGEFWPVEAETLHELYEDPASEWPN